MIFDYDLLSKVLLCSVFSGMLSAGAIFFTILSISLLSLAFVLLSCQVRFIENCVLVLR